MRGEPMPARRGRTVRGRRTMRVERLVSCCWFYYAPISKSRNCGLTVLTHELAIISLIPGDLLPEVRDLLPPVRQKMTHASEHLARVASSFVWVRRSFAAGAAKDDACPANIGAGRVIFCLGPAIFCRRGGKR